MRYGRTAAFLLVAGLAGSSAPAQTPAPSDATQERHDDGNSDLIWNLLGLVGIVGVTGLWRPADNDGYTSDPV